MSNGTQINVVTNTVEIRNANRRIDIVAPNTGTTIAVTQPTTRVVQVNVPGPQGVQGEAGAAADVASLNTFTGSIQTQVNSLTAATSSYVLNAVTASMLQPYVLNASTASFVTNAQTSSMSVLSASFASTASYINPTFISASAAASGFGSVPAETDPIFVAKSASLATTGSNVYNGNQYVIGVVTASLFKGDTEGTASWARNALTASAVDTLNQNVTILGNLQVFGTASYTYVTASQLDVGTEWISVNVAEPGERFGGLKVYDSGSLSHQATASLAWDSLHNHWVYQNASGSTYSGGMLISGPRNTGSLGDEPELTRWFVTRGDGGDHINSTQIFSSGSVHQITGSLTVTDSLTVPGNIDSTTRTLVTPGGYFIDYSSDIRFKTDTFLTNILDNGILQDLATRDDGIFCAGHIINTTVNTYPGLVARVIGNLGWDTPRNDRPWEAGAILGIGIDDKQVLLFGDMSVNDNDSGIGFYINPGSITMAPGVKVYMSDYATTGIAGMSLELPTQGYVRELGYIYYASTSDVHQFVMRFNPSSNWYLLS